jgi:argininosuccinate synthase
MKIVLAYSGGLDTSAVVARYSDEGHQVVAVFCDLGQPGDPDLARERAAKAGAVECEKVDCLEVFARDYMTPALLANAKYEGRYALVSGLSRPCISAVLVDAARRHGADAVAHGCTGKGNDQIRFELSLRTLAPDLKVLAPIRDWKMSRPASLSLLGGKGISTEVTAQSLYSVDESVWGRTCEAGDLEDPWRTPPARAFTWTTDPLQAPRDPAEVVVGFRSGLPASIDGREASFLEILRELNELGSRYGYGRVDMIENRRMGIKSREVYETPGALALIEAHRHLEDLCLEREVLHEKARWEIRWAELVYDGLWFSPLREAFDVLFTHCNQRVDGDVRLLFTPGQCTVVGRRSPNAIYDDDLVTYGDNDQFPHEAAPGFIQIWGLSSVEWSKVHRIGVKR